MRQARWILAVLAVFALVAAACGDADDAAPAPAPAEEAAPADSAEEPMEEAEPAEEPMDEAEPAEEPMDEEEPMEEAAPSDGTGYSVAFVFDGFLDDGGWNTTHNRGVEDVRAALPGLDIQLVTEISPGPSATNACEDLAEAGVDMVIATGFYQPDAEPVAAAYPDTIFLTWAGWTTTDNMGPFDGATEDGRYLDGLIAGSVTETGIIGYPAGFPIEEVNRALNAFTIGVREMNPDAVVQAVYINSWYDPPAEQQAAEALANAGADVLAHELNSPAVASVAESRGLNIIGYSSDRSAEAPNAWLSSFTFEWGGYYTDQIKSMMDGIWEPALSYGGLADGFIGNAPYGPDVSDEILALVEERRQGIIDGTFDYFAGPLVDNEGNVQVPDGGTIPFGERTLCCLWLIEGIEGSIN
ncbi:MAG: BMP family ABC transporter substrate-binding protein [Acidimicrobiaceae bacterium]|nr:BMP family ABC transporter substrate-binding protein [Acidimicrobiaceae bacterium]